MRILTMLDHTDGHQFVMDVVLVGEKGAMAIGYAMEKDSRYIETGQQEWCLCQNDGVEGLRCGGVWKIKTDIILIIQILLILIHFVYDWYAPVYDGGAKIRCHFRLEIYYSITSR